VKNARRVDHQGLAVQPVSTKRWLAEGRGKKKSASVAVVAMTAHRLEADVSELGLQMRLEKLLHIGHVDQLILPRPVGMLECRIVGLLDLEDVPRFEYEAREGSTSSSDASAGQQATALMFVLLNQDGPPLAIEAIKPKPYSTCATAFAPC
jgi:hypothetical protein